MKLRVKKGKSVRRSIALTSKIEIPRRAGFLYFERFAAPIYKMYKNFL